MFEIRHAEDGAILLCGRLDAVQAERLAGVFARIVTPTTIDFRELDYISSAGLGILFATHKRLVDAGGALRLVHLKPHIRELFGIGGFDKLFELE
jgi:anti-sigma B factor antagonist